MVTLGVHVDEAGRGKWRNEEAIDEHVGMKLSASHEVLAVCACL